MEIKEAIENAKQMGRCLDKESFNTLITFAKSALSGEGQPKRKDLMSYSEGSKERLIAKAVNKRDDIWRLWCAAEMRRKCEGLESVINDADPGCAEKSIAEAIRTHFEVNP